METAKLFWSGRSQAVRLPKSYRFEGGDGGHTHKHGGSILPDSLRWLWRGQSSVAAGKTED